MRCVLALAVVLAATPALAVDFNQVVVDDNGCPFRDELTTVTTTATIAGQPGPSKECPTPDGQHKPDLTLGQAVYYALRQTYPDEPSVTGNDKFKRAELAARVRTAPDYTPNSEEVTLLKLVVGKMFTPPLVFAIYPKIDPALAPKK